MCGISGKLYADPARAVDPALLERMNAVLAHRGPDDAGIYHDGPIGLAHRRLSIIDLGGGQQPITNEDRSLWIVFNGEIFNYIELRAELEARGHRFSTHTDTEVILHLFEDIYDIIASEFVPKPDAACYHRFLAAHGVDATASAMSANLGLRFTPSSAATLTTSAICSLVRVLVPSRSISTVAPVMESAAVMTRPVPTLALAKLPACTKVNTSLFCTPTKLPPVSTALVVPSYVLLAAVVPLTVNALGVTVMVPGVA